MTLGQKIQAARKATGMSQEALAARVGVSRQALGKWEKDTALPGLDNLRALAEALGTPVEELLGAAGQPSGPAVTLEALHALLDARDAEQKRLRRRTVCLAAAVAAVLLLLAGGVLRDYRRQLADANARLDALGSAAGQTNASIASLAGQLDELQQAVRQGESSVLTWDYTPDGTPQRLRAVRNLTVCVRVMPRSARPGLGAELLVEQAGTEEIFPLEEEPSGYYTAKLAFHKGDRPALRVRWLYVDGTSAVETLGEISLAEADLFPEFRWAMVDDELSYKYYDYPQEGRLSLACLPVELEIALPPWMTAQSGEVVLWVDGEERAAVPLDIQNGVRECGYLAHLPEQAASQPYAGGEVALTARVTDSAGYLWESEPITMTRMP